jgi:D-beta-D-heptose 7-phosphate kinase/D-beta-D-heptose 1-phosphate adenosyltransferase
MLPPVAPERARAIVAGLERAHVLVVGDVMLDRFVAGRVTRISPEAPISQSLSPSSRKLAGKRSL